MSTPSGNKDKQAEDDEAYNEAHPLFHSMARCPLPFLLFAPILFGALIYFGWSTDDKVETEVARLWIAQDGDYAQDQAYAEALGIGTLGSSSFAAMSITRDGGNIMTAERLEEVRARMEATEATTIEHNGKTYTWDDFCAVNSAPYQFPCLRLTPMDLFEESRWAFTVPDKVAWYQNVLLGILVGPRLPRFGTLTSSCAQECQYLLALRTAPEALGLPAEIANPLALFADLGSMEFNNPCRVCVEEKYDGSIVQLHQLAQGMFTVLSLELMRYKATLVDNEEKATRVQGIIDNVAALAQELTTDDIVEFYSYYTERGLYAQLGAPALLTGYADLRDLVTICNQNAIRLELECPPNTVTLEQAQAYMAAHADSPFSSVSTAGSPLPLWDSNGDMFGFEGGLGAIGGSGIDMSADVGSVAGFLDLPNVRTPETWRPAYGVNGFADPDSDLYKALVEKNPMYAWFMAGKTPADPATYCANGALNGTNTGVAQLDGTTASIAAGLISSSWCTPFDVPNEDNQPDETYTKQHFAKMWYNLLIASPGFLNVVQGEDDPYTWTTGSGCDYNLAGGRFSYTNQTEDDILSNASRIVYNIDEGVSIGPVDRNIIVGGADPVVGEYSFENPLKTATVIQTLYAALIPKDIVQRVSNCNRPDGALNLTMEEAEEVLYKWKEAMEGTWTKGWDDESDGDVQFVAFFDDSGGVVGSTGRMLEEITLDNTVLTMASIVVITVFSALFLFSTDIVESRVLITLVGVVLVVISFFAALGFGLLVGTKINVTIAWTLPFVIIGLGVDDVYIIMLSLKNQKGYTERHWQDAMKEVVIPVTMTSLVNASMFAVLNVSDIPAIYLSSRVACYCVIALYFSVMFCFPAYCYLDLKRQGAGRNDVCVCAELPEEKRAEQLENLKKDDFRQVAIYDNFYKPIILNEDPNVRRPVHALVFLLSIAMFGGAIYGIMEERKVGLGLEDFFPSSNPASRWATYRTEELSSWAVGINWGELDYSNPDIQMQMISQFERVIDTKYMAEVDTKQLWLPQFQIWTTRHCGDNFGRSTFDERICGRDQIYDKDNSTCAGMWTENKYGLRETLFSDPTFGDPLDDTCLAYTGGICRPGSQLFPAEIEEMNLVNVTDPSSMSFCPVISGWSDDKFKFCLEQWRAVTGASGGSFLTETGTATETECSGVTLNDAELKWPVKLTTGPTMFAFDLFSHEDTLDMMRETRAICDNDEEVHCWMTGIPYDYWSQYDGIFEVLVELSLYAVAAGFGISLLFFLGEFAHAGTHSCGAVVGGSIIGAFLIAVTMVMTLVPVVGLSALAGVNLTGFSNMSFVLSVGFAVEYSVHIVSRFMRADDHYVSSLERVEHTMSFLTLPTFMSFVSSTIGVVCLAFTEFEFNQVFFFRPLIIVMFVSYWFGCWFLPVFLCYLDFDIVKMGVPDAAHAHHEAAEPAIEEAAVMTVPTQQKKVPVDAEEMQC